jgi:hypothetical protein
MKYLKLFEGTYKGTTNDVDEEDLYDEYIKSGFISLEEYFDKEIEAKFSALPINQVNTIFNDLKSKFQVIVNYYVWNKLEDLVVKRVEEDPTQYKKYKGALNILDIDKKIPNWIKRSDNVGLWDAKIKGKE